FCHLSTFPLSSIKKNFINSSDQLNFLAMNKVIFFFCALFQKQTATVLLSCILLSSAIGCSENLTFENNAGCSGKEYVKEARNIEGFIYFDDEQKKYAI